MSNNNLTKAKKAKCDEFYTQYTDIEKELQHYDFEDKIVYCNCDHPIQSNFVKYFCDNYHKLKLKGLISTFYSEEGKSFVYRYDGLKETKKGLNGNGDYKSEECINILKIADVIVTNPPFSLFRPYIKLLMDYNKKFLIIGNSNAVTYKEIFPYIKNNELWLGCRTLGSDFFFNVPEDYKDELMATKTQGGGWKIIDGKVMGRVANACWFTNIPYINSNKILTLTKTYNPIDYPQYDNYNAINVDKVKDIPSDYDGVMGVPITFLQYYNPSQFEIVAQMANTNVDDNNFGYPFVFGKKKYARILIKKNDSLEPVEFEIVDARDYTNIDKLKSKSTYLIKDKDGIINGKPTYARLLIKRKQ